MNFGKVKVTNPLTISGLSFWHIFPSLFSAETNIMYHLRLLSLATVLVLAASLNWGCRKADRLTQFNISYVSQATISSGMAVSLPFDTMTPEMETRSETEFEVNDTRKDKVQEIKLTSLQLQITAPGTQEFDFLKDIEIYIDADGLGETLLASKYNIDDSVGSSLSLDVSRSDFQAYIKQDRFTLRLNAVTDRTIAQDVDLDIYSTFFVNAKLIGKA